MASIQSSVAPLEISTDGSVFKTLVCLTDVGLAMTREVSENETYCGVSTGLGSLKAEVTFDAACETAPSGTQASYEDVLGYMSAGTLIYFRWQHDGTGTYFYHKATGYFTQLELTGSTGEVITFSGTITMDGALDITP
jgi:hypothetical protein